ncbi:hypothetical protein FOA52_011942 [Chlamydomonas sp. UWO 241]|nr:hypothetical protein FOA52_011942 [Chlamydomonas sp. UWO 241]
MGRTSHLTRLSAYARPDSELVTHTTHGAIVTCLGVLLALVLFINELHFYSALRVTQMSVDLARRHDLPINVDISFPAVPCALLSVDVLDVSGTSENDASFAKDMRLHKKRLDPLGNVIGVPEYLTPQSQHLMADHMGGAVMNVNIMEAHKHLLDMEDEEKQHEGCRLTGTMVVRRVAGRLHVSSHQGMIWKMMPQLLGEHHVPKATNMSHTVHEVSFGAHFPGLVNPLDGFDRVVTSGEAPKTYKYFVKVVPTEYYGRWGGPVTETNQYSVTEYVSKVLPSEPGEPEPQPPAFDIMYDISPIVVTVNDSPTTTLHFVVRLCAVVGGVFAVTRMMDRWVHWAVKAVTQ